LCTTTKEKVCNYFKNSNINIFDGLCSNTCFQSNYEINEDGFGRKKSKKKTKRNKMMSEGGGK